MRVFISLILLAVFAKFGEQNREYDRPVRTKRDTKPSAQLMIQQRTNQRPESELNVLSLYYNSLSHLANEDTSLYNQRDAHLKETSLS